MLDRRKMTVKPTVIEVKYLYCIELYLNLIALGRDIASYPSSF